MLPHVLPEIFRIALERVGDLAALLVEQGVDGPEAPLEARVVPLDQRALGLYLLLLQGYAPSPNSGAYSSGSWERTSPSSPGVTASRTTSMTTRACRAASATSTPSLSATRR